MEVQQMRVFQSTRPVKGATALVGAAAESNLTFQSTRPVKGATGANLHLQDHVFSFNPRAP